MYRAPERLEQGPSPPAVHMYNALPTEMADKLHVTIFIVSLMVLTAFEFLTLCL